MPRQAPAERGHRHDSDHTLGPSLKDGLAWIIHHGMGRLARDQAFRGARSAIWVKLLSQQRARLRKAKWTAIKRMPIA